MLWSYLKTVKKPILIYGMGNGAEKIMDHLESLSIPISGVFASDGFARHNVFRGYTVISYTEARAMYDDMVALIAFGSQRKDVLDLFKSMLNQCELYAPDVPVYGDTMFDLAYAKKNESRLKAVYDLLADDVSREVFRNTVMYKLTGDIRLLFGCETSPAEAYCNILVLGNKETYVDLGAYTGDTVHEFVSFTKGYDKIVAVEPDKKSFKKLTGNVSGLNNIELYNIGISSRNVYLPFLMEGGRQSVIGKGGEKILCRSVDDILSGDPATYIKMDVEGMELEAIKGCRETISRYKPKLNIAAYHRSGDYMDIPELVFSIRDDYKLYMRHFPYVPAWDTNYYFV